MTLEAAFGKKIMKLIKGQGPTVKSIAAAANDKMSLGDAVQRLSGRLPEDVEALVRITSTKTTKETKSNMHGEFDESSLAKARQILNGMVEGSVKELDQVLIECKEFEERNRGTFGQVTTDLARLGAQIADLSRKRVEANEGINAKDAERNSVEDELKRVTLDFTTTRLANEAELTIRTNDLAVFNFILEMTRCKESEEAFAQLEMNATDRRAELALEQTPAPARICTEGDADDLFIRFDDPKKQAHFERMMTPSARQALREALGEVEVGRVGLFQKRHGVVHRGSFMRRFEKEDPETTTAAPAIVNTTTLALPTFAVPTQPAIEEPNPAGQWKKCTDGKPNCGLLHDTMSLQWGKFKDLVDELTFEMATNADAYEELKENFNSQLTVISDGKAHFMELLAETISGINADTEEMNEKDTQSRDLEQMYRKRMGECKAKAEEILFTNICAVRKVRNSVMTHSTVSPPEKISDCDVSDWIAGECDLDCDDTCPQTDPYACGGWQTLTREVVVAPNAFGLLCPALSTKKKCNQFKCPIDCVLSEWSGFSKCTKDCEGGVQQKTRSLLTKAKNGGESCDTTSEARSCNTGSCDRDCALVPWSEWSPCTMACGGGNQERIRSVSIPIRGKGKCPKPKNADRLETRVCNAQDCIGDEVCIAKQDLIIAVDGSGSLKESGFEVLREFAVNVTGRYRSEYFGQEMMQVGALVFGNGRVEDDGTISPALRVQGLTSDIAMVGSKIMELQWQRGLTNMAQAFTLADTMLQQGGRSWAQSAVLVLSDGKSSFEFQTAQQVQKLKDNNVMVFMAPIAASQDKSLEVLKKWASQPWETNYERIPGLLALKHNTEMFAQKVIAKFCSQSFSPSANKEKVDATEYMLIHEGGEPNSECASVTNVGYMPSVDECAASVRELGQLAFLFGTGRYEANICKAVNIETTIELWNNWETDRRSPACPGGLWNSNPYFDVYALRPLTEDIAAF
jgi:hypothetical protein